MVIILYYIERIKVIGGGRESMYMIGWEWREMSPQDNLKYKEEGEELQ